MLLTSGLGILVYKNLDSIGHVVVLVFIELVSTACFSYCYKNKKPFSKAMVQSPASFFDNILLLGVLCSLLFIGYLQYQYHVFGLHYGMATFIPMLLLFYIAYNFDHPGILNLAIINLGLWLGVTVTPRQLLAYYTFNNETIIYTYFGFGLLLIAFARLTEIYDFKSHFKFSYLHYGIHVSYFVLFLYFTLRFADRLMSLLTICWFLAFIYFGWKNLGSFGMVTMPFIMMLVKKPKFGFTYAENNNAGYMDRIKIESLIIVQNSGNTTAAESASRFGGGTSGGGGATVNY